MPTRCAPATFEPDGPNWTPRISGTVRVCGSGMFTKMSILKARRRRRQPSAIVILMNIHDCPAGTGRFIHTYQVRRRSLAQFFRANRRRLPSRATRTSLPKSVWNALNEENKVSLFVQFIDLASGKADTRIVNKNV